MVTYFIFTFASLPSDFNLKLILWSMDVLTGEEYNKLLAHAKNYLPFLERVMENTKILGIQEEHLNKLRSLYEMVDCKRLAFVLDLSMIIIILLDIWIPNLNIVCTTEL